jgi:hypothetical protein
VWTWRLRVVAWCERESAVGSRRTTAAIVIAAEHISERVILPVSSCFAVFTASDAAIGTAVRGGVVVVVVVVVHFRDELPEVAEVGHDVEWCCVLK